MQSIESKDGTGPAEHVLTRILEVVRRLSELPLRGSCPGELASIGVRDYRQIRFKPYRIVYRTIGNQVFVELIAGSRRDMNQLLSERMRPDE